MSTTEETAAPKMIKQHANESTDRVWTLTCEADDRFDGAWMGDTPWAIDQCAAHVSERVTTLGAAIPDGLLLRVSDTDDPIRVRDMYTRFLRNQTRDKGDEAGAAVFERTFKNSRGRARPVGGRMRSPADQPEPLTVVHPMDDVPEEKRDPSALGPMGLKGGKLAAMIALKGYLALMAGLVLYRLVCAVAHHSTR